jgi:quaternary ammonium compound-resistance protein SugE
MPWTCLLIAGLLEVAWAIGLKYSEGFTRPWISVATALGMIASFYFLSLALRHIPVGTGYAVWTGIGAAGTAILGIILFAEALTPLRVISLLLIIAGIVGLRVAGQ